MASCIPHRTAIPQPLAGPRRPQGGTLLPQSDYTHLLEHLDICERDRARSSALLARVLHHKIVTTLPSRELVTRDVVVGGSRVSYRLGGGAVASGLLVQRARLGSRQLGIIPVASLLGATLIGMRVGQRAPLLCEDGTVTSLVVVDTLPPN